MTPVTRVRYHWKEEKLLFINNLHIYFEYKGLWNVNPLKLDYLFFDTHCMISVYKGYIRSILDYGVPVFNGGLTGKHCKLLEHIQKRACKIILGDQYTTYEAALEIFSLQSLEDRRKKLCTDFATTLAKNPLCQDWLPVSESNYYSLRKKTKYKQFLC